MASRKNKHQLNVEIAEKQIEIAEKAAEFGERRREHLTAIAKIDEDLKQYQAKMNLEMMHLRHKLEEAKE